MMLNVTIGRCVAGYLAKDRSKCFCGRAQWQVGSMVNGSTTWLQAIHASGAAPLRSGAGGAGVKFEGSIDQHHDGGSVAVFAGMHLPQFDRHTPPDAR